MLVSFSNSLYPNISRAGKIKIDRTFQQFNSNIKEHYVRGLDSIYWDSVTWEDIFLILESPLSGLTL